MTIVTKLEELRKPNDFVTKEEVADIIKQLESNIGNGLGLAAPQIAIHKKVCIIRVPHGLNCEFVNPVITDMDDEVICKGEGCLSFPGVYVSTKRYNQITVKDETYPSGIVLSDLDAQVVQHEIDHLNGIVMFDRQVASTIAGNKIGRNEPCSCGSGKKYKKCCGR